MQVYSACQCEDWLQSLHLWTTTGYSFLHVHSSSREEQWGRVLTPTGIQRWELRTTSPQTQTTPDMCHAWVVSFLPCTQVILWLWQATCPQAGLQQSLYLSSSASCVQQGPSQTLTRIAHLDLRDAAKVSHIKEEAVNLTCFVCWWSNGHSVAI